MKNDKEAAVEEILTGEEPKCSFMVQLKVWNGDRELEVSNEAPDVFFDVPDEELEAVVEATARITTVNLLKALRRLSSPLILAE